MPYSPLVATDARDSLAYPISFQKAHEQGIPHRAVHIEIANRGGKYLVWQRSDGRWEIPGGHVDWLAEQEQSESYSVAAIRETIEELNLQTNWNLPASLTVDRLKKQLKYITKVINQVPSSHGYNNEWVAIFSLDWEETWGNPCNFVLGEEGNKSPIWRSLEEIMRIGLENPLGINAALRLFLGRRGILIPVVSEFPA